MIYYYLLSLKRCPKRGVERKLLVFDLFDRIEAGNNHEKKIPKLKNNQIFTRGITAKRVTSGEIYLRGVAPEQHSFKETLQRWRAVDLKSNPNLMNR